MPQKLYIDLVNSFVISSKELHHLKVSKAVILEVFI